MPSTANLSPRIVRRVRTATLLMLSLCSASAWAICDPNNIKHMPCPAPVHSSVALPNYVGPRPAGSVKKPLGYTAARKPLVGPVSPGPRSGSAGGKHGAIFVGGKPTNARAALNPQPIPPGHPDSPLEHLH